MTTTVKIPPQHTWLVIFLPALLYYILLSNRNSSGSSSSSSSSSSILSHLGLFPNHFTSVSAHLDVLSSPSSNSRLLDSIFPSSSSSSFSAYSSSSSLPLLKFDYIIQNKNDDDTNTNRKTKTKVQLNKNKLVDTVWVEDLELGRGYLLISDLYNHGTVWRYEIGGGPIPIGKSLFMDYSGCRSDLWNTCSMNHDDTDEIYHGSSGVTIQVTKDEETFLTGQLIIVEKGEQRIIRLEEDGSRTPLVLNVTTSLCNNNDNESARPSSYRILKPSLVYYTPFGDLLFTDHNVNGCNNHNRQGAVAGVYRLKEVVNVPPLSFQRSKDAHGWTESDLQNHWVEHGFVSDADADADADSSQSTATTSELLYSGDFEYISGMVVGKDLTSLYIAGRVSSNVIVGNDNQSPNVKYVIVKVPIDDDEGDQDDDNVDNDDDDDDDDDDHHHHSSTSDNDAAKQAIPNEIKNENMENNGIRKKGLLDEKTTSFIDMTDLFESSSICLPKLVEMDAGISLAIDETGLIYATYPGGIAIIHDSDDTSRGSLVATLTFQENMNDQVSDDGDVGENRVCSSDFDSNIIPSSITIGKDQYIYVTTEEGLMRMKTKARPLEHPTNLIVPSKKIK